MTDDNGATVGDNQNSQTAGPNGPVLLQDGHLLQKLQRFDRERIPERGACARHRCARRIRRQRGSLRPDLRGAVPPGRGDAGVRSLLHGHRRQRVAGNLSRSARFLHQVLYPPRQLGPGGQPLAGVLHPRRDQVPGRHPLASPSPTTNLPDPERTFDFFARVPEATHMLTRLFSDYGTPASYRHMEGSSVHAYKLVNARGEVHYVRFDWQPLQGVKNLSAKQASAIQARDSNHATRDLVEAINRGDTEGTCTSRSSPRSNWTTSPSTRWTRPRSGPAWRGARSAP